MPFCERGQDADAQWVTFKWPGNFLPFSGLAKLQQYCQQRGGLLRIPVFWLQLLAEVTTRKPASDSLRAGRPKDRIPVEARYSAPVLTGSGPHPRLLYNGYRGITGGKAAVAWRWLPTLSIAEVKERVELPLLPPWDFVACYRVNVTFTFNLRLCAASCKQFRILYAPKDQPSF